MLFVQILFVAVLLSGLILVICFHKKRFLGIPRLVVDTEMGRGFTAIFTGITTLCTIFTLKEFGFLPLLVIPFVFELCALFSATLGLALYPIMIKSAVSISSGANKLKKECSEDLEKVFTKHAISTNEEIIGNILEEGKFIEQIIKGKEKGEEFWVYFLILIYYYAFSFALIGIAFLIVVFGSIVF